MASIVVNGDTSGAVTLSAPAVAGTVTVTLPSASGTMAVSGGSPSFTTITTTSDASISGLTVGKGGGAVSTNTAVGLTALNATATGGFNTGVGANSLKAVTSGTTNTATGHNSLLTNTTGSSNAAFGQGALELNTTGANNTALGYNALQANTTASNNTAVGYQAGYSSVTGTPNVYVGYQTGYYQTANYNTALGAQALYGASGTSTGSASCAIGFKALYANTTGNYNVALGNEYTGNWGAPLSSNTTGSANAAIGTGALALNTTGSHNIAIGYIALNQSAGASSMTAVGSQAGYAVSGSAGGFTGFGYQAGNNFTSGFNSTFIGNGVQAGAPTGNNEIVIGTNGQTGKGSSTGFIAPSTGGVYQGNNSSSWSTTSDFRLKKNIVDNTEGLEIISQIRVRNFEYRTAEEVTELPAHTVIRKQGVQLGVIAQELQEVCPDCVKTETTGVISVDSDNIFWHMVNAIKDLKAELDTVKAELAALKG
jgi:hypothetical protein